MTPTLPELTRTFTRIGFLSFGGHALHAQDRSGPFREFAALLAGNDGAAGGVGMGGDGCLGQMQAGRDQARIGGKIRVGTDVENQGAVGRADQAGKLGNGNLAEICHGVHPWGWQGCDTWAGASRGVRGPHAALVLVGRGLVKRGFLISGRRQTGAEAGWGRCRQASG